MKVYLKSNWSEQFTFGDETPGFFVGRKQEIKGLKNVIGGNNSSAVLISSVRGVGKTSFVHKTLSEIDNIHPVFVNIGHALANADVKKEENKKLVLISLIRAAHFSEKFRNDSKLGDLYKKCFAEYREEDCKSTESETKKEIGLQGESKIDVRVVFGLLAVLLTAVGLNLDNLITRLIVGFMGVGGLFLSFTLKKSLIEKITKRNSLVIDNSTEYLEIEFENWLRAQGKSQKVVFVIDELDKIEDEKSLKMIKEYKNLFNNSFAHFIFIASHDTFNLISGDREKSVSDGGIFPTLFTHVFYISLPKTEELKEYLNAIFNQDSASGKEHEELISYLLFRSGNDFFELKRLISDVLSFDNDDKPFIDTDKVKAGDPFFSRIAGLFEYIDQWFLQKHRRELKKYWKDNSQLQKSVFQFLNKNFGKNFKEVAVSNDLKDLVVFLLNIGSLESEKVEVADKPGEKITQYRWTKKYRRSVEAPLFEDDEKFNESFRKLIKLANDLDDLPEVYETNEFSNHDSVEEDGDGQDLSGIDLYSIFSDYEDIFEKLKEPSQRIFVTAEKTREARTIINEQISNVYAKYFEIVTSILSEILKDCSEMSKKETINSANYDISKVFSSLPDFVSIVAPTAYQSAVYCRTDQTKYVLIIRNFKDEEHIQKALSALNSKKNILTINIVHGNEYKINSPKVFMNALGRKRKRGVEVKNFINFEFNDFRQLSEILNRIKKHLG